MRWVSREKDRWSNDGKLTEREKHKTTEKETHKGIISKSTHRRNRIMTQVWVMSVCRWCQSVWVLLVGLFVCQCCASIMLLVFVVVMVVLWLTQPGDIRATASLKMFEAATTCSHCGFGWRFPPVPENFLSTHTHTLIKWTSTEPPKRPNDRTLVTEPLNDH